MRFARRAKVNFARYGIDDRSISCGNAVDDADRPDRVAAMPSALATTATWLWLDAILDHKAAQYRLRS